MARLLYKCRLCGKIDDSFSCDDQTASEKACEITQKGVTRSFRLNRRFTMFDEHHCINGDMGITDFVGYRLEDE